MSAQVVTIVETGIANTASVVAGLARCGAEVELTRERRRVEAAERVVLPGVGAFGAGMTALFEADLADVIRTRVAETRPTLAICLGLQLLCRASVETPGAPGLGVIDAALEATPRAVRSPQFGWNRVTPGPGCDLLEPGDAYFANAFRLPVAPVGWSAAYADHGGQFVAALQRGGVLACQFHPELSGAWGRALLGRWLARCAEGVTC